MSDLEKLIYVMTNSKTEEWRFRMEKEESLIVMRAFIADQM